MPEPGEQRLDAHHYLGYGLYYVLLVQWLCHACHTSVHLNEVGADGQSEGQRRAKKAWETRRQRYGPTGLSPTPRVNAKSRT